MLSETNRWSFAPNSEEAGELPNLSVDKTSASVVAHPASELPDNVAIAPEGAQPTVNQSHQGSAAKPKYRFYVKAFAVLVSRLSPVTLR